MKRILTFIIALAMLFALAGCGSGSKKVNVKEHTMSGTKCVSFTVSGSLGSSGTVKITGNVVDRYGYLRTLNNAAYSYTKSGDTVSMTAKSWDTVPKSIKGTYNTITNTFTLDAKSMEYCEIYNYYK